MIKKFQKELQIVFNEVCGEGGNVCEETVAVLVFQTLST
jgi:hypothetical protein